MPDLGIHCKAVLIKEVWCWLQIRHTWVPEANLHTAANQFAAEMHEHTRERTLFNTGAEETGNPLTEERAWTLISSVNKLKVD